MKDVAKAILRKVLELSILGALVFAFFWTGLGQKTVEKTQELVQSNLDISEKNIPSLSDPKYVAFKWKHQNKNLSLDMIFYGSVNDFYAKSQKEYRYYGELSQNWAEDYYAIFLQTAKGDNSISELAAKLNSLGDANKFSDDEKVEMVMSFVQSITYDEQKARLILTGDFSQKPRFPHEVLFEESGVCSGKSFLAHSLLKEMGYGVALFEYEQDKHIAIGIKCPLEFSTYGSGYCYAETTALGNKVGIIPDFRSDTNQAAELTQLDYFEDDRQGVATKKLGEVKIYQKIDGKTYAGIVKTVQTQQKIDLLKQQISNMREALKKDKAGIDGLESKIVPMGKKLESYDFSDSDSYKEYNKMVKRYNGLVEEYKSDVKKYNADIKTYNKKVDEYNALVKNF